MPTAPLGPSNTGTMATVMTMCESFSSMGPLAGIGGSGKGNSAGEGETTAIELLRRLRLTPTKIRTHAWQVAEWAEERPI